MRKRLVKAENTETLRDVLARIGPPGLAAFLSDGPGFRVQFSGKDVELERIQGDGLRYQFAGTGLVADVTIDVSSELGAVVQQVTLINEGTDPSLPIRTVNAFYLPFDVFVKDEPYAYGFGGGLTQGFYPPRSYREEAVGFGKAQDWTPPDPSFTRWWVAQQWYTLACGDEGRSSSPDFPLMLVGWNSPEGELGLWAALEWSGRWELKMGATENLSWHFVFQGGPRVKGMVLEPGEVIRLPAVHIGVFGGPAVTHEDGFNSVRRYISDVLAPDVEGRRPWPYIAYHHWFGIEHNLSDSLLRRQVDRAAELGIEFFEIDAGWYGGASENFANGVGNWERVDEMKFPDGLEPFAEYVRSKGVRFGLWFEPERGRIGSDWVTQHPDWYWDIGSPVNFQLDLTNREVQDYLIEMLSTWIEKLDIRWLRWDANSSPGPFWDAVDPTGKVQFAYIEGLYRVRDAILGRFPNLMIDNCAGGGTRTDFGTLRRAGTTVISDHAEDPHICRVMQTGGARILPGNYMNSSFYIGPDDGDSPVGPLELMSRMAGAMSLSGHIANWSQQQTARVRGYLDGYRAFRHLLMKDFYSLTPYPRTVADWDVVQFIDPETSEAVVLSYRVRGSEATKVVFPKRLDADTTFEIIDPFSIVPSEKVAGQALMTDGLRIALEPESAKIRHLKPKE